MGAARGPRQKNPDVLRAKPISTREVLANVGMHPRLLDGLRAAVWTGDMGDTCSGTWVTHSFYPIGVL